MSSSNSNKHLTFEERTIIEKGIRSGATKAAIASTIGKDKSTICKEISAHRQRTKTCNLPLECAAYKKCKHNYARFAILYIALILLLDSIGTNTYMHFVIAPVFILLALWSKATETNEGDGKI